MSPQLRKNLWFGYLVALSVWSILAYGKLGDYLIHGTMFATVMDKRPYISDFVNVYNGGLLARRCLTEPDLEIYNIQTQAESVARLVAPVVPEAPFYLQYPPYFFAMMLPLSFLPISGAWLLWAAMGMLMIFLTGRKLAADNIPKGFSTVFFWAAAYGSFPTWYSCKLGQTTFMLIYPLLCFWLLLRENRSGWAGALAAFMSVKLQYTPFLGIAGLVLGKARFVGSAVGSGLLLLAASALIVRPDNVINYPKFLLGGETGTTVSGVNASEMQNLRGFLALVSGDDTRAIQLIAVGFMALAIAAVALIWSVLYKQLRLRDKDAFTVLAAVTVLVMLCFSPHTHSQDYMLTIIPFCWLWSWSHRLRIENNSRAATLMTRTLAAFPALSWMFFFVGFLFKLCFIPPYFFFNLLILGLTGWLIRKILATPALHAAQALPEH